MKISDLQFGQIGYWYSYWNQDIDSIKFVECEIDGEQYVAAIRNDKYKNQGISLAKDFKDFFKTFGELCDSENPQYNKNKDCYLTKEEALEAARIEKIDKKIEELNKKRNSLIKTKLDLINLEKEILETDFEKEILELERLKKENLGEKLGEKKEKNNS